MTGTSTYNVATNVLGSSFKPFHHIFWRCDRRQVLVSARKLCPCQVAVLMIYPIQLPRLEAQGCIDSNFIPKIKESKYLVLREQLNSILISYCVGFWRLSTLFLALSKILCCRTDASNAFMRVSRMPAAYNSPLHSSYFTDSSSILSCHAVIFHRKKYLFKLL